MAAAPTTGRKRSQARGFVHKTVALINWILVSLDFGLSACATCQMSLTATRVCILDLTTGEAIEQENDFCRVLRFVEGQIERKATWIEVAQNEQLELIDL